VVAYIIRRVIFSIVVLFFASIVIFGLVRLSGDPLVQLRQNPQISQSDIQRLTHIYGLDQPAYIQYGLWMKGILTQGSLGTSFLQQESVNAIIGRRVWPTVLLMGSSLVVTVLIAVPLGVYSAVRKYSLTDKVTTFFSFVGFSLPSFFLGLMLQLVLGIYLTELAGRRIFFTSGMSSPNAGGFVDLLQHLALPVVSLAVVSIASYSRFQRSSMLDVLSEDYIRTARAKGLRLRSVYFKHALRNALIPVVTLIALDIAYSFGGAVITETIFAWPGIGFLLYDSLGKGDYNVARAILLIIAVLVVFFNLIVEVAYALLDPRVSYE
jgi:peptide/nickel transport system permease protein